MRIVRCGLNEGHWLIYRRPDTERAEFEHLAAFARERHLVLKVAQGSDNALAFELYGLSPDDERAFLARFGVWCNPVDGAMGTIAEFPPRLPGEG
jgi:hypothetical protein